MVMLKYEIEKLSSEVKALFPAKSEIEITYCGHFIEDVKDRKVVDFKCPDGSYRKDYIDCGQVYLILRYTSKSDKALIETELNTIYQLIVKQGFEIRGSADSPYTEDRGVGEITVAFNGIRRAWYESHEI